MTPAVADATAGEVSVKGVDVAVPSRAASV
jgi:hypothetical protein